MTDHPNDTHIYYLPNKIGRILLLSYEEVIGQAALIAVQKTAGIQPMSQSQFPSNHQRKFRFNDLSPIHEGLERMYGPHAGRGISMKAGQVSFKYGLCELGPPLGISKLAFRLLPLSKKIQMGVQTVTDIFNRYTDQSVTLRQEPDSYLWEMEHCPLCWNRKADSPCCHLFVGLFQELLFWVSGGKNYLIEETTCIATADHACTFQIARHPLE